MTLLTTVLIVIGLPVSDGHPSVLTNFGACGELVGSTNSPDMNRWRTFVGVPIIVAYPGEWPFVCDGFEKQWYVVRTQCLSAASETSNSSPVKLS